MKKFLFYLILFWIFDIFAIPSEPCANTLNHCKLTKNILNNHEPAVFESTNNLLRKTGQFAQFQGKKIIIKGTVLDQNCVPVADAKVYLWQAGIGGIYPYKPLKIQANKRRFFGAKDSTFTGSGTATTNNKGEYYFVSMLPYTDVKNAYVRVKHANLKTLHTKLSFTDNNICYNECGEMMKPLYDAEKKIIAYCFDLVLQGTVLKKY